MKKIICLFLAICMLLPMAMATHAETTSLTFEVKNTGSAGSTKRLVIRNYSADIPKGSDLVGWYLNGTATYLGTGDYSATVPFENVPLTVSEMNAGWGTIGFKVPEGYTICMDNTEDANYTWDLTLSQAPADLGGGEETPDVSEHTSFFMTKESFIDLGDWIIDDRYVRATGNMEKPAVSYVKAPADGTYYIWGQYYKPTEAAKTVKMSVNGTAMADFGTAEQSTGHHWVQIGSVVLTKDQRVEVSLNTNSTSYARLEGILFTTNAAYDTSAITSSVIASNMATLTGGPFRATHQNLIFTCADFASDMGTWIENPTGVLRGVTSKKEWEEATAKILVENPGTYYVWGYCQDYVGEQGENRACKVAINGTELSGLICNHNTNGLGWDLAGTYTFTKANSQVLLALHEQDMYYSRVKAIVLTTDPLFQGVNATEYSAALKTYKGTTAQNALEVVNVSSVENELSFSVKNRTDANYDGMAVVAAIYDDNGMLKDVQTTQLEGGLASKKAKNNINVSFDATVSWTNGKMFVWEGLSTMKPLLQVVPFSYKQDDYVVDDDFGVDSSGAVTSFMPDYKVSTATYPYPAEYNVRNGIYNTLKKLENGENVTIAYLGGSITQQESWRPHTTRWFRETYPNATITEREIGLAGTSADLAVCRIEQDMLTPYNPDLVFIEYAVNGGTEKNPSAREGMEGMVRKIRRHNPQTDIVFVYTSVTKNKTDYYEKGAYHPAAASFETVAEYYGIPSVAFAVQAFDLCDQGKLVLKASEATAGKITYTTDGGTHLSNDGGYLAAGAVGRCVTAMRTDFDFNNYTIQNYSTPQTPLVAGNWEKATYTEDWSKMTFTGDWFSCAGTQTLDGKTVPANFDYSTGYAESFVELFPNLKGTKASDGTASVTVKFKGTAIGVFEAGGPYSGWLSVTVDGVQQEKDMRMFNTYDSKPRHQYNFISGLTDEEHTVTFTFKAMTLEDKEYYKTGAAAGGDYAKNEFYLGKILVVGELLDNNQ